MLSRFKLAVRIQRFEFWSCVLLVAMVGITALIVRARLDGVGAPAECLTPATFKDIVYDAARCETLVKAFGQINRDDGDLVMTAMTVVPLVIGLVLGTGLVGREIESGTASTVWALAGSRRRWLMSRLVPILAVLIALLAFSAVTSDLLAASRVPWQFGRPAFNDAGLHGASVVVRGLAAFGLALAVGALSGRTLPTILISALLTLFVWIGGQGLFTAWVNANAHEIVVPLHYNGTYDGGKFISGLDHYRLPDGTIADRATDVRALAPTGVDPERWVADEVVVVAVGVHSPDYPGWLAAETAAFGTFGIAWLATTFAIVERRRPF
jgi:hypothetical protein